MATPTPFTWLEQVFQQIPKPNWQPPAWAVDEAQQRLLLLLNHVLQQEPEAMARMARQSGRQLRVSWLALSVQLRLTPAGLLDRGDSSTPDLTLVLTDESPLALAQSLMQGGKPAVRIEGDVQLAAEVSWLIEHVRWDLEEDLARVIGDVPAHALGQAARRAQTALRDFVARASAWVPGAPRR